jgi:beta-glucosidase
VEAWYPGQAGGSALADILFGDYNPAGRLPVTFYASADDLPPFSDYAMAGRTYKYFQGVPLFPFGHGLSYTTFTYGHLEIPDSVEAGESFQVSVTVGNTGDRAGEEVVQLYLTDEDASVPVPIRSLQGVKRLYLEAGGVERVTFTLTPEQLSLVADDGERMVEPGWFLISVGGRQPPAEGIDQSRIANLITGRFRVVGSPLRLRRPTP